MSEVVENAVPRWSLGRGEHGDGAVRDWRPCGLTCPARLDLVTSLPKSVLDAKVVEDEGGGIRPIRFRSLAEPRHPGLNRR